MFMPILMHFIILFGAYAHLMSNPNVGLCATFPAANLYLIMRDLLTTVEIKTLVGETVAVRRR